MAHTVREPACQGYRALTLRALEHVRHPAPARRCLVRPATRWRQIQVQHRYSEHPIVKRNYCLRSHLRGLVFTLNHIAVTEDSAIVCVHDSDQHHENDHWRRRWRWRPRRRWRWRPRRRWRWRPLRPKPLSPYDCAPLVPTAESWGARPVRRLSRGGIGVLSEPPVSRFCSRVHPS
jgi:hypothetical protein